MTLNCAVGLPTDRDKANAKKGDEDEPLAICVSDRVSVQRALFVFVNH